MTLHLQGPSSPSIAIRDLASKVAASATPRGDYLTLSTDIPTVTVGMNTQTPTISGAVLVAPKLYDATRQDVLNDPAFEVLGVAPTHMAVSSTDFVRPDNLTNGASNAARYGVRFRFWHQGTAFEFYGRLPGSTGLAYRIKVDGRPVTVDYQTVAGSAGNRYVGKVAFSSARTRLIELDIDDPQFGGVFIEPTGSLYRPRERRINLAGLGDSHMGGATGVSRNSTYLAWTAARLNMDWTNLGIGGSGFLNGGVTDPLQTVYRNRLVPDLFPCNPDVVLVEGSFNDNAFTAAQVQAEALSVFQTIKANLPNALLIAAGPWVTASTTSQSLLDRDNAVRAAAQAGGFHGFISFRDSLNLANQGLAPAWAATTVYKAGDVRFANTFPQRCVVSHTSAATFDQTKWTPLSLVRGTGKVGATVGDGNADVVTGTDGTHASQEGHYIKAAFMESEIRRIAQSVATGSTWAV